MSNHHAMTIRDYLAARHLHSFSRTRTGSARQLPPDRDAFHRLLRGREAHTGLTAADYRTAAIRVRRRPLEDAHPETERPLRESDCRAPGECAVDKETAVTHAETAGPPASAVARPLDLPVESRPGPGRLIDRSIVEAARKYNLAPRLIRAVVRAESNFQVDARSPAGAQGLMQLMPATARELGVNDSFDIDQNIDGGSRYLRQMLDRYSGNLRMALAAYNAGPGNVDKYGGRVPFAETRQYIDRVLMFSREAG